MSEKTEKHCQRCGKQLSPDVLDGLCPACLMTVGDSATTAGMGKSFEPPTPEEVGRLFPALEIMELLGRGGMGAVYKARQPKLDRYVALKLLTRVKDPKLSEAEFAARFQQEARALARLAHPDIVAVHDFGEAGGYHYLLMEYVDGVTLRQLLRTQKLSPEQALRIVPKICEALQFAHERGIVHRDIKPENILLDKEGRVKIADFGIAKIVEAETGGAALTGAKDVIGTPHYMAPEQVEKPQTVDHRADIYSLGVVFYEMLTGELPLGKFQPPSKKVQVDVRLDEVVLHTLEKEPERRYQNVSEVKSDLETIATTSGSSRREEAQTDGLATRQSLVASAATSQDSRFSRTAIVGACWAPLFLFVAFAFMSVRVVQAGEYHGPEWWQYLLMFTLLPLGLAAPFGTTILGWVAVSQIRRSAGKLYGMWLAVCDGLFFPLLALGGVIFGLLYWIFVEELHWKLSLVVLLTLIIAVSLGVFLVRRVWRAVNARSSEPKSAAFAQSAIGNRQSVGSGWGWMGTAVGLHAVLLMAVVAFFVFAVPRFVEQFSSLAVALPTGTLLTIKFAQFIRTGGFHLVPLLLALDVAICWLVQRFAGRRLLGAWFAMVSLGLTALVLGSVWLLNLPFQELLTTERERNERMLEVLQFGPEKEVTLTEFNNMDGQEALDLDTGTVFKQPKDMDQWSETGFGQWVRENGVDLFVDHGPGGLWGLMTTTDAGLKLARLENDKWSAIRAAELAQVLAGGPKALQIVKQGIMKVYLPPKEARPPMTCAFKTGNGGVGVLQITGYTGNPSGVKIRYKLAQGPTETTAINRSPFPKAAHVGENSRSVMRVDDDVDLYYAFFHAGNFDSDWRGSHNTKTKTWQDDGDLTLKNGRSFGYRRDSTDPDHLRVNGREFDLRAGRVLVLNDDGSIAQLARFPSLAVARDLSELARLVGAQGGNRAGRVATQRSENKFVSLYRAELGQKVLDAARDFVEEHGWKMLAESGGKEGNPERVVFLAVDRFSKAIEFEEVVPVEGKARFSISTEPGAELSAQRIGAAIWRRLGLAAVPDPATTTVFGPVMERMVADIDEARGKECLILETGALLDFPKAELKGLTKAEQEAWFVDRGVNLLMDTVNGRRGLGLRDMTVTLVPNEAWEREDRAEVEQAIALGKPGVEFKDRGGFRWHIMPTNAPLPLTFAFRMGSGRVGLLQVLDFKDDPGGVTLRCKLAAGAADQTKPTATNAVVAAPVTPNPQEAVTRARLRQLSSAIDTFEVDCGAYPGSLDVLVRNPGGLDWKGPYFPANSWPPKDAWGTPFQIEVGDQPRNRKPSILSAGPDKQFGTADDLVEKVINPATFGPVMESVLKAPQVGPEGRVAELLDLDTGRRGSSANFGDNDRETHAWLRTNQLDVLGVIEHGQIAVLCFDMTVMPAVSNDWETVTAQNVVTNWNLAQSEPNKITGISPMTDNTDTWLFRTREGGHGILQILGQSSDPLGVKIRYKLVQTADSVAVSQPSPAPARRMIAQAPFSAKLEEGEVELAALSYYPSANEPWWAPDGGAAKGGPFVTEASGDSSADFRMFALVARLRNVPADASQPVWKLEPRNSWAEGKVLPPDEKADGKLVMISCKQPRSAVTANVKIGIASGDWETVARARAAAVNPGVQPGPKGSATFVPLADSEAGLRVTVTHNYKDTEIRLMAIDSDGSSRDGKDLEQVLSEKIGHTTMTFPGLSLKQAAQQRVEFHFQVRPYHWVEFHNVSLKPGRWTQVEVQDALRN